MKPRTPRDAARISISFKDTSPDEPVRRQVEARCQRLAERFPETNRIEITLAGDGVGHVAHGHVTGKRTEVATHASGTEMAEAAERLLVRVERQLRRGHDKRIYAGRREAQRSRLKG